MSERESGRRPRPRSRRGRLAFSGALDLRLERVMERHLERRFQAANIRALRERHGEAPRKEWLGPIRPFAALVLFCRGGDFERGLPDPDTALIAWRLTVRGWTRLAEIPADGRKPWWSGLMAFAVSQDRSRLALIESWRPAEVTGEIYRLLWHEKWLELLPVST